MFKKYFTYLYTVNYFTLILYVIILLLEYYSKNAAQVAQSLVFKTF